MSTKLAVGRSTPVQPRGPLSTRPRIVRVAKRLPFLLSFISLGCNTSGTSLPIRRPISALILGIVTPFRCGQGLTSSGVSMVSVDTGRLGLE